MAIDHQLHGGIPIHDLALRLALGGISCGLLLMLLGRRTLRPHSLQLAH
jgi:hypothetical protein